MSLTHSQHRGIFNQDSLAQLEEYVTRHFHHLAEIERAIRDSQSSSEYTRKKSMVALDGTGGGVLNWQVPLGFDWILERVTLTSTGAGTATFYIDTTNPSDQVQSIGNSQLYSDAFQNDIFVPSGSLLYVVFAGAGNNGQATVNLQIKVLERKTNVSSLRKMQVGNA